jgi:hypothetical protein
MSHMRYWAMSFGAGVAGGSLAVERFAFAPNHAVTIAFWVAIAAAVFSLAGTGVALLRENQTFAGLSALSALVAGWTIIATRTFTTPTALWLAFAGGLALLLLSLRALALHETTVERVVHALAWSGSGDGTPTITTSSVSSEGFSAAWDRPVRGGLSVSGEMRSWLQWLSNTGLALGGAFVVLTTFAWQHPGQSLSSPRWVWFGVAVAAASITLVALLEHGLAVRDEGAKPARIAALLLTAAGAVVAIGLVVMMIALHGADARWWAFGLGSGMVGASLVASALHELTSERVRHELELAHASTPTREPAIQSAR